MDWMDSTPPASPEFEPDSMELEMMNMAIPELSASLKCCPDDEDWQFQQEGYIALGEMQRVLNREEPIPHLSSASFRLFGGLVEATTNDMENPRKLQVLLAMFCQRMEMISGNADLNIHGIDVQMEIEHAKQFLAFVRNAAFTVRLDDKKAKLLLALLKDMHLFLGPLDDLSAVSLASPSSPRSRYLHLRFDALSTILFAIFVLNAFSQKRENDEQNGRMEFCHFIGFTSSNKACSNHALHRGVSSIVKQILIELVLLATEKYDRLPTANSPFSCLCIQELWTIVYHFCGDLDMQFWDILRDCCSFVENRIDQSEDFDCSVIQYFKTPVPPSVFWRLLRHLVPLASIGRDGKALQKPALIDYTTVEKHLKASINYFETAGYDESLMRICIGTLLRTTQDWGASFPVVVTLWEFFSKRLNENFRTKIMSLEGTAVMPKNIGAWLSMKCSEAERNNNAFQLFLMLLVAQLNGPGAKKDELKKRKAKFFARIRLKLTPRKLSDLNDLGWFHLLSLLLILIREDCCTYNAKDVIDFLREISLQSSGHVLTVARGLGAICVTMAEKEIGNFGEIMETIITQLETLVESSISRPRDLSARRSADDGIVLFADLLHTGLQRSPMVFLEQEALVQPWIRRYIKHLGSQTTIQSLLEALSALVLRLRRYSSRLTDSELTEEQRQRRKRINVTLENIWSHVYPMIRDDLSSSLTAPSIQVSDLAASLAMLCLDRQNEKDIARLEIREDQFSSIVLHFSLNRLVHPLTASNFMLNLLRSNENVAGKCLSLNGDPIVKGCFRCSLMLDPRTCEPLRCLTTVIEKTTNVHSGDENQDWTENFLIGWSAESSKNFSDYLDIYVDYCKSIKISQLQPRERVLRLYRVGGWIFRYCIDLFYVKGGMNAALNNMINHLLSPGVGELSLTNDQHAAIRLSLMDFITGLSRVAHNDQFIVQTLKKLFMAYLTQFMAARNPLLQIFDCGSPDLRQLLLDTIRSNFFVKQRSPERVRTATEILNEALKRDGRTKVQITKGFLQHILQVVLHEENGQTPGSALSKARNSCQDALRQILSPSPAVDPDVKRDVTEMCHNVLRTFIFEKLSFHSKPLFRLLHVIRVLDRSLVRGLLPDLEEAVREVETKRRVVSDVELRRELQNLQTKALAE